MNRFLSHRLLRSKNLNAFGDNKTIKSFTQESGTRTIVQLDPIIKEHSSLDINNSTTLIDIMAFYFMGNPCSYQEHKIGVHFNAPIFDIQLIYVRESCVGPKLYVDPSNHIVVRTKYLPQVLEPFVMVMLQEN